MSWTSGAAIAGGAPLMLGGSKGFGCGAFTGRVDLTMISARDRENEATLTGRSRWTVSSSALCGMDALGASAYQVSGHKIVSRQGILSELPVSVAQTRQQKLNSEPGGTSGAFSLTCVM